MQNCLLNFLLEILQKTLKTLKSIFALHFFFLKFNQLSFMTKNSITFHPKWPTIESLLNHNLTTDKTSTQPNPNATTTNLLIGISSFHAQLLNSSSLKVWFRQNSNKIYAGTKKQLAYLWKYLLTSFRVHSNPLTVPTMEIYVMKFSSNNGFEFPFDVLRQSFLLKKT